MIRYAIVVLYLTVAVFVANAQRRQLTLVFAGDAMQHLPQIEGARTEAGSYNYDSCFYLIRDKISAADIACVNMETTLGGRPYRGYPLFSAPDQFAEGLQNAGFDIFFLANNHILDRGKRGLERTIDVLSSMEIKHTGAFKSDTVRQLKYPLMVIKNGFRLAFLNYTYGTNDLTAKPPNIVNLIDTSAIKRDIATAKLYNPDIIIANMHWGPEYRTSPSKRQQQIADMLLRNGVRIVIGHHPHVVQPVRTNRNTDGSIGSVVYFSLGNFISNQQNPNTDGGMVADIVLTKANDNAPVTIESCRHFLVWVRKQTDARRKTKYCLIPSPSSVTREDIPTLSPAEIVEMATFVSRATTIIADNNR